jgi:branched-chain amino acid transport system substrate-binding protein
MIRTERSALRNGAVLVSLGLLFIAGCGDKEVIRFGAVIPLTGEQAIYGKEIANGIQLAYDQQKATGKAPTLELVIVDSKSDPETGKIELERLYSEGARAAIGGVTTPEALAQVEVADRMNRVLISPSASAKELTGISSYFYRVWPSNTREGGKMGQYAAQNLNLATATVLAADTPYADGISSEFVNSFEQNGGKVLEVIEYPKNTDDLTALVERLVSLKPDGIYVADYAEAVVKIIEMIKADGYEGGILTASAFATPQAIATAGSAAEGVFVTLPQFEPDDQDTPEVKAFVDAYRARYGETPGNYAAHGYDAFNILYAASQQGGDKAHSFWKGMKAIKDFPGATGPLQFDDKGDVTKYPRVYFVHEGRVVDHANWRQKMIDEIRKQREELIRQRRALTSSGSS